MLRGVLTFSERNPGITRVLMGDALVGEHEELTLRVERYFARLETQLRQVLREGASDWVTGEGAERESVAAMAAMMSTLLEGRLRQYVRTRFQSKPLTGWDAQWTLLSALLNTSFCYDFIRAEASVSYTHLRAHETRHDLE